MEQYLSLISSKTTFPFTSCQLYYDFISLRSKTMKLNKLKEMAKEKGIKVSGTKSTLIERLEQYLKLSFFAIKIQRIVKVRIQQRLKSIKTIQRFVRRYILREIIRLRGPAYFRRNLCTNEYDFLTGDDMASIEANQFFSYTGGDNFTFGFDLISITNLIKKAPDPNVSLTKIVLNPYNRQPIPETVLLKLKRLVKLCKLRKISIVTEIASAKSNTANSHQHQNSPPTAENRVHELFQAFDALGNYTCSRWFTDLNCAMMIRFLRELSDIWHYRSQLPPHVKREICPPYGDPFRNIMHMTFADHTMYSRDTIQLVCLQVMEILTFRGVNVDRRTVGVYYILGSLTLVSNDAATALPWLYDSFH
jgi:hypothetical protein